MALKISDLWQWQGSIERGPYFSWGFILLAFKYNLDRLVAGVFFDRPWSPFTYLSASDGQGFEALFQPGNFNFYATMVALALPFIYTGTVLTLRRLNSVGLPGGLVAFFFLPIVNLLFFTALAVIPARSPESDPPRSRTWERWLPQTAWGSALAGMFLTAPPGILVALIGIMLFEDYGWGIFVGIPFVMGMLSVLIYGYKQDRRLMSCLGVAAGSVLILGLCFMAFAIEGIVCLLMAAPLGFPLALMGGTLGYFIQRHSQPGQSQSTMALFLSLILSLPALMGFEKLDKPQAPVIAVRTAIEIDAPPEAVWKHVIEFSALPPPADWILKLGIAYPLRAEIKGRGVGSVRHCVFTTGPFVEPIEIWDEPRLLKFKVTEQPRPMEEWTPYPELNPPHLDHFLQSQGGQFLLTPLASGRTRLEGTTWYTHQIWPGRYWQVWSDLIIHRIHLRVLQHIQKLAETEKHTR